MFGILIATIVCACALLDPAAGESLPRDLKEWRIEYVVGGGLRGIDQQLTVASDGTVVVADQFAAERVESRAPDELVATITAFLKIARNAKPPKSPPTPEMSDAFGAWLSVETGGHDYSLEMTPEIVSLLSGAMDAAVKQAVIGTWWQSAWKLCKPAPQLARSDMEPPIEALVFEADGGFSVTWRGGGAHTTGVPHVFVPDYRGRYSLSPQTGSIQMHIDNGLFVPSDFSGHGSLRINKNQLTVRNVWFGTKQAKQKPDICELTFTRK
jgi:hypothetical protein